MFLNGNGISFNLFKVLKEEHDRLWCNLDIHLPDTIIFVKKKPARWFFVNKAGKLKSKVIASITADNIVRQFTKKPKRKNKKFRVKSSGIVAYFLSDKKSRKDGSITTKC